MSNLKEDVGQLDDSKQGKWGKRGKIKNKPKTIGKIPDYLLLKKLLFDGLECNLNCRSCLFTNEGPRKEEFERLTGGFCGASIIYNFIKMVAENRG